MKNLIDAARDALALLKTIHEKEMERTKEYDMLPFPEMVELENAIDIFTVARPSISGRELATILSALRYWQQDLEHNHATGEPVISEHFEKEKPLTTKQIDGLCERLNGEMQNQNISGIPIIFVEGGIVQDVFLSIPDGSNPSTPVDYDLLDMDVTEGNPDEDLANHFNNLSPESQRYFRKHCPDTYKPFRLAIARHKLALRKKTTKK